MGEGPESSSAWIVRFAGDLTHSGSFSIKIIKELWTAGFSFIIDADTNYYPMGSMAESVVYYRGTGEPGTRKEFIAVPPLITWVNIEVGIEEEQILNTTGKSLFIRSPNPFNNGVDVTFKGVKPGSDIWVTNILGQNRMKVPVGDRTDGAVRFNFDSQPAGTYLISVIKENGETETGSVIYMK